MTRYVIGPDVAIRLAQDQAVIRGGHQVLAPALLRSQVLSLLYQDLVPIAPIEALYGPKPALRAALPREHTHLTL
jgi:hypothetical protein